MRMPWGKFKGEYVDELDNEYLWWLYGRDLKPPLANIVKQEVYNRWPERFELVYHQILQQPTNLDIKRMIRNTYYRLASKWHPDHGGNTQAMQAINDFKDNLLEML